jgi:hypothetical protein
VYYISVIVVQKGVEHFPIFFKNKKDYDNLVNTFLGDDDIEIVGRPKIEKIGYPNPIKYPNVFTDIFNFNPSMMNYLFKAYNKDREALNYLMKDTKFLDFLGGEIVRWKAFCDFTKLYGIASLSVEIIEYLIELYEKGGLS